MQAVALLFLLLIVAMASGWKRSSLIYFKENRSMDEWRRHVCRIDSNGKYIPEQLFDAAILTRDFFGPERKDVTTAILNESELNNLLDDFFSEAQKLDESLNIFREQFGTAAKVTDVIIGVPGFTGSNVELELSGRRYKMANPSERAQAAVWYVNGIISRAKGVDWKNLRLYGTYYIKEELLDETQYLAYAQALNKATHERGLGTVWVPYFDAANGWNGNGAGFNVTVVQPRYAFLSSIDGADLKGDRLYSTGYKAAGLKQGMEYELRSQGESRLEYYIAHQYLAISQYTGAASYPQVFFVGGIEEYPDLFDRVKGESSTPTYVWKSYQDLANYLRGDAILNWEVGVQIPDSREGNVIEIKWTVSEFAENLNSIRLDFSDPSATSWWRGRVAVQAGGATSYAQRIGSEILNPNYNSVYVPVGNLNTSKGSRITIQITREIGSPWPNFKLLVAAKFEPPTVATSIFQETSLSSRPNVPSRYKDSEPTHLGYAKGKLTDGKVSPVNGFWWDGAMGWYWIEYPFSVMIDLGRVRSVSQVKVVGHQSQVSAANLPNRLGAMTSSACQPQPRGISGSSCLPTATTGTVTTTSSGGSLRNMTMYFLPRTSGRYVTVTGLANAWSIFDEIEILDDSKSVISVGAPYRITPITGEIASGDQPIYGDNCQRLVDGNVFPSWIPGTGADGIAANGSKGGSAEATWTVPRRASSALVWITQGNNGFGIKYPQSISVSWRDSRYQWQKSANVAPSDCGPAPCAKLQLAPNTTVTGVRANFPPEAWYMLTEISLQ